MACAERSELVRPPPCSSPSSPSVQPRGRGKKGPPGWQPSKDRGKPLCHPPCLVPTSLDRLMGGGGAVGVGSPSLLAPLSPGKSRTVSLGNSPSGQMPHSPGKPRPEWEPHITVCMEGPREPRPGVPTTLHSLHGRDPRAPPWCAYHTSQFAWKGPESPALVCPQHFTVCMERPREPCPRVPTTLHSFHLSLMTIVWLSPRAREPQVPTSPSPSGPPAGALAPPWFLLGVSSAVAGPRVGLGPRDPVVPLSRPPRGFSWSQGCPWL